MRLIPRSSAQRSAVISISIRGHRRPRRLMKWALDTALCWIALIGCAIRSADADTADRIVAIVNDEVITEADVASRVSAFLQDDQPATEKPRDPAVVRDMMLHRLIEQRLILQEAKRLGVTVRPEEILDRLDEVRSRFTSDMELEGSLEEAGLSLERLKEQLRDQLMVERVVDSKVRATIVVSPQEVANEVRAHPELGKPGDRVRARHILIRVHESRSEAQARALIEDVRRQLDAGAEFAALATRYSEDPHAEEGGAMGWVAQGELLPELDAALFSLKAGELSSPIQTRLGFHLVEVEERKSASSLTIMEANHAVHQQLYQRKTQEAFARWAAELARRAYIEIVPPDGRNEGGGRAAGG